MSLFLCSVHSSNILLDENLQPKLSDFGLAHLRPHSVNQSFTIVMDTGSHSNLGYLPEEYIRDGKLSVKLDVYSLGMVSSASFFKNGIPEPGTICINKDLRQNLNGKNSAPAAEYCSLIFPSHLLLTSHDSPNIIHLFFVS